MDRVTWMVHQNEALRREPEVAVWRHLLPMNLIQRTVQAATYPSWTTAMNMCTEGVSSLSTSVNVQLYFSMEM